MSELLLLFSQQKQEYNVLLMQNADMSKENFPDMHKLYIYFDPNNISIEIYQLNLIFIQ